MQRDLHIHVTYLIMIYWYNLLDTVISISAGAHDHKACLLFFFLNISELGLVKDGFK